MIIAVKNNDSANKIQIFFYSKDQYNIKITLTLHTSQMFGKLIYPIGVFYPIRLPSSRLQRSIL